MMSSASEASESKESTQLALHNKREKNKNFCTKLLKTLWWRPRVTLATSKTSTLWRCSILQKKNSLLRSTMSRSYMTKEYTHMALSKWFPQQVSNLHWPLTPRAMLSYQLGIKFSKSLAREYLSIKTWMDIPSKSSKTLPLRRRKVMTASTGQMMMLSLAK